MVLDINQANKMLYQLDCAKFIEDIIAPSCNPPMQLKWFHREWINLFNDNRFVSLLAPRGSGKAETLDSKLLTPNGWKLMRDIQVGDEVIGFDGKPTKVTGLHPRGKMDVYKIKTSDDRICRCSGDHLWTLQTPQNTGDRFITKSISEFAKNYKKERIDSRNGSSFVEYRHFLPTCKPIEFSEKKFIIEPYTFGAWLGDGDSTGDGITTDDIEILDYLQYKNIKRPKSLYRYGLYGLKPDIKKLGLYKNKYIPEEYLFGSIEQRTLLLQGLLDTDGYNMTDGYMFEFSNKNKKIIDGFVSLVRSLGGTTKVRERYTTCTYKGIKKRFHSYRVFGKVPDGILPFRLKRKLNTWHGSLKTRSPIISIEPDGFEEVQCIQIENSDGLYITDDYMVTHNSQLVGTYIIWKIVTNPKIRILVITINQQMADDIMSFIQRHLEGNAELIKTFGIPTDSGNISLRGYSDWSRSIIRVLGAGNQKDPTLKVLGITASMVGGHHDMIILDDVMDSNNSRTEHRREEVIRQFENTIMPMLVPPRGKVLSIATRWHEKDISAYLQAIPDFASRIYKSVIKYPEENNGVAEVLWPEVFPYEELMKIKERYGSLAFEMQYQNNIVSLEDSPIKREWIDRAFADFTIPEPPYEVYMGVDFASKGEESDFFVIVIIAVKDAKVYVLDALRTKASLFRQFDLIGSYDSKWQPIRMGVEQAAQQKIIVDQLIESTTLPIMPIKSSIVNDRMSRVQRLSVLFETGRILMNPENEAVRVLSDEAIIFPHGSNDDLLDGLSFAVQASQYADEETHLDWNLIPSMVSSRRIDESVNHVRKRNYDFQKI